MNKNEQKELSQESLSANKAPSLTLLVVNTLTKVTTIFMKVTNLMLMLNMADTNLFQELDETFNEVNSLIKTLMEPLE